MRRLISFEIETQKGPQNRAPRIRILSFVTYSGNIGKIIHLERLNGLFRIGVDSGKFLIIRSSRCKQPKFFESDITSTTGDKRTSCAKDKIVTQSRFLTSQNSQTSPKDQKSKCNSH
jgi:hypothetical protein